MFIEQCPADFQPEQPKVFGAGNLLILNLCFNGIYD